jgi:WD40 repeat protein
MKKLLTVLFLLFSLVKVTSQPNYVLPTGNIFPITSAKFSFSNNYVLATYKNHAVYWDIKSGKQIHDLVHSEDISSYEFSSDDKYVLTVTFDNTAHIWNLISGKKVHILEHDDNIQSAVFSHDNKFVLTASSDSTAKIWDVVTGEQIHVLKHPTDIVYSAEFSLDDKFVLTTSDEGTNIWNIESEKITKNIHPYYYESIFSPNNELILTNGFSNLYLFNSENGKEINQISNYLISRIIFYKFTSETANIVAVYENGEIGTYNNNGRLIRRIKLNTEKSINKVAFSSDNKYILTTYGSSIIPYPTKVCLWNAKNGKLIKKFEGKKIGFEFSSDNKFISSYSRDEDCLEIWKVKSGRLYRKMKGAAQSFKEAAFSSDGSQFVLSSNDNRIRVFNAKDLNRIQTHEGGAFSSDCKLRISADTSAVWDMQTNKILKKIDLKERKSVFLGKNNKLAIKIEEGLTNFVNLESGDIYNSFDYKNEKLIELSSDFKYALTEKDSSLTVWNTENKQIVKSIPNNYYSQAKFSDNNRHLIISTYYPPAIIIDIDSDNKPRELNQSDNIQSVNFSPDNKLALSWSWNKVFIWDVKTGNLIDSLLKQDISSALFSPDGKMIITLGFDKKCTFWDVKTKKILFTFLQLEDYNWLVYDENSNYDGSQSAIENLYFVKDLNIIEISETPNSSYVPNLVQKIIEKNYE